MENREWSGGLITSRLPRSERARNYCANGGDDDDAGCVLAHCASLHACAKRGNSPNVHECAPPALRILRDSLHCLVPFVISNRN